MGDVIPFPSQPPPEEEPVELLYLPPLEELLIPLDEEES